MFAMTAPKRSGRCDSINVAVQIAIAARTCRWMVGAIIAMTSAIVHAGGVCLPYWSDQFTGGSFGGDAAVAALEFDDDGSGPNRPMLYFSGWFDTADGYAANKIARWDGTSFSAVGSGLNAPALALASFDPDHRGPQQPLLIAGGVAPSSIVQWDGVAWSSVGTGTNDFVTALAVFDEDGEGPLPPALFAGGLFTSAGGAAANFIARWNGAAWTPVGGGMSAPVRTLVVWDPDEAGPAPAVLVAGGEFTSAGSESANHVAQWDGRAWSPMGAGMNDDVTALCTYDMDGDGPVAARLIAGGGFSVAGSTLANSIAAWDGESWSVLGSGLTGEEFTASGALVNTMAVFDLEDDGHDELLVGGQFNGAGASTAEAIAVWDGTEWTAILPFEVGPNGVDVLIVSSVGALGRPVLYASGSSSAITDGIAKWIGTEFQGLGGGISGADVHVIAAVSESKSDSPSQIVYVGGTPVQEIPGGENIARWDGSEWSALGAGLDGSVYALLAVNHDGDPRTAEVVYAGGIFTHSGLLPLERVARWNGSAWSPLGSGVDSDFGLTVVAALAPYDADGSGPAMSSIIAGGEFIEAGGMSASNIASWNGASWSALGVGVNDVVRALAVFDEDGDGPIPAALFAGGDFTSAGGQPAAYIARWDGAAWSAVGGGMDGSVRTLHVFDEDGTGPNPSVLIAGGEFFNAGVTPALSIARWNGAVWSAMGAGFFGPVYCLSSVELDGNGPEPVRLVAGGAFIASGSRAVDSLGAWDGQEWLPIGGGVDQPVSALAAVKDSPADTTRQALFVGGMFGLSGGISSRHVARWGCDPNASPSCPADQNEDGIVNGFDLAELLASWGACLIPAGCEADLDDNGVINGLDLALLLGAWGPC